jgi:hypothetical protein
MARVMAGIMVGIMAGVIVAAVLAAPAAATNRVPRVDSRVHADGVLDEELWSRALVLDLGYEVDPGENIIPPVRTEVLLAYGPNDLYVGFRAFDPEPAAISTRVTDRDLIWNDDWVGIVLDTFHDQRSSYQFACNPRGVQGDKIVSADGGGEAWDGIWTSAGRVTADGYRVEMVIPFRILRFPRSDGDQTWGVDAVRVYPRKLRHELALVSRDRGNNCYLCQIDNLVGFAGARPGRNIELDPTLSAVRSEKGGESSGRFEPGLTAHWGMTSDMALSVALNPDFSQVEADAMQLDVNTRLALSYPEKRPFFLAGADLFQTKMPAVYTRALAEPSWGVKLAGKHGRNALGVFVVEDDVTNLLFPASESTGRESLPMDNTATVLRYRRDLGRASTIGVLLTERQGQDYSNRLLAVDGNLRFSAEGSLRFQVLGSRTRYPPDLPTSHHQPRGEFDGTAVDAYFRHETRDNLLYALHKQISPEFRADLGFITRAGYSRTQAGWSHHWYRNPGHWFTRIKLHSAFQVDRDGDGHSLSKVAMVSINYDGPYRSNLNFNNVVGIETVNGIELDSLYIEFINSWWPAANVAMVFHGKIGNAPDYVHARQGKLTRLQPGIEWRLGNHLTLKLNHSFERLEVTGGRLYRVHLDELRAVYQFTRRAFLRTIVQYQDRKRDPDLYAKAVDPEYRRLFTQLLFSYKINPQTVLFLGYSDDQSGDQDVGLTRDDRTVFLKVGYAWLF